MIANHHCWVKSEKSSSSCVGSGSLASNSLKNAVNCGSTKPTRIDDGDDRHDEDDRRVGQRRLHLLARLEVALEVERELVEHDVELTGDLRRAEDADVVGREHVAVAGERLRERDAGLDLLGDVLEDRPEPLVRRALAHGLDRVDDRDAGPDERADLAGEVHDLRALDLLLGDLDLR